MSDQIKHIIHRGEKYKGMFQYIVIFDDGSFDVCSQDSEVVKKGLKDLKYTQSISISKNFVRLKSIGTVLKGNPKFTVHMGEDDTEDYIYFPNIDSRIYINDFKFFGVGFVNKNDLKSSPHFSWII